MNPFTHPSNSWRSQHLGWFVLLALLCACQPAPTATPSATAPALTITPSPTFEIPTRAPTVTFTPSPPPSATPDVLAGLGPVILQDDFQRNRGWQSPFGAAGGMSFLEGGMTLVANRPGAVFSALSPAPQVQDFLLEVKAQSEICSDEDEYGVFFRSNENNEQYRFTLTCNGRARVTRLLQSGEIGLLPLTETSVAIAGAPAENRISVWAWGDQFRFSINGYEVHSMREPSLPSGRFGLLVIAKRGGQTTVTFDDLIVRSLLPTPAPDATDAQPASPTP